MTTQLNIGDIVKFKKQYQDKGDDLIDFVIVELFSDGDMTVEAQIGWHINPTYRATLEMLEF